MEVTEWCIEKKLKMCFTQGLDIRLLDIEIANQLYKFKNHHILTFAFDSLKEEKVVRRGVELLQQAGFTRNMLRAHVQFYVYVDSDEEYDSGLYRARELKKMNCNAFVMFNIDNERSQRITDLQRWANRKQLFWQMDIVDYKGSIRASKKLHRSNA